jgi:transposase
VCLVQLVLDDGWSGAETSATFHVGERTVWKWVARYQAGELPALRDASSRPNRSPHQTVPRLELRIVALQAQRLSGPRIADRLGLPLSAVSDVLRRHGLGRLPPLVSSPPVIRYERERPGELLHVDSKKLGRIEAGTVGVIASPAIARSVGGAKPWDGIICMWPSMMPRASRMPRSCPTKPP